MASLKIYDEYTFLGQALFIIAQKVFYFSMEYSSMVSKAAFRPRDPGSNPGCFTVSNSNQK